MTTYEWITTFLVPVTGIVSWLAGARMRKNSTINAMQTTIDMLVEQNADLYKKILDLRQENTDLRVSINAGNIEIERLKTEIERLKK
jgi:peptidoglycan hydrolase CwlO-like protein